MCRESTGGVFDGRGDADPAEQLHRPDIDPACLRLGRGGGPALDQHRRYALMAQEQGRGQAGQSAADDEDRIRVYVVHHVYVVHRWLNSGKEVCTVTEEVPGPLIWSLPEPPGRPTTDLSRAEILRAGMAIADAEGARALTMRRVAQAVGASTPMSLYRYVGSKDGLVDLMIDAVYGEVPLADAPAPAAHSDWRGALERLALDTWTVIQRHLWFGELVHTRPRWDRMRCATSISVSRCSNRSVCPPTTSHC